MVSQSIANRMGGILSQINANYGGDYFVQTVYKFASKRKNTLRLCCFFNDLYLNFIVKRHFALPVLTLRHSEVLLTLTFQIFHNVPGREYQLSYRFI